MWFIVKILWTWNLFFTLLEISKPPFFFSFLAMSLLQLLKKKKIIPLFWQWHCRDCLFFFFKEHSTLGHTRTHSIRAGKLGSGISSIPLPKFNIFSLPILSPSFSFSFSLFSLLLFILSPAFWLNFGNAIAEIQSLSSFSQLSLNSSYNAN